MITHGVPGYVSYAVQGRCFSYFERFHFSCGKSLVKIVCTYNGEVFVNKENKQFFK